MLSGWAGGRGRSGAEGDRGGFMGPVGVGSAARVWPSGTHSLNGKPQLEQKRGG